MGSAERNVHARDVRRQREFVDDAVPSRVEPNRSAHRSGSGSAAPTSVPTGGRGAVAYASLAIASRASRDRLETISRRAIRLSLRTPPPRCPARSHMPKMYDELAEWWPLLSPPSEYEE